MGLSEYLLGPSIPESVSMTTIAYDGVTLAADKQATYGNRRATFTKIFAHKGYRMAICGTAVTGLRLVEWFKGGADPKDWPEDAKDTTLVVITPGGEVLEFLDTPTPLRLEDKFLSWGSGEDFAKAAMYLGKTAKEAVEVASALDTLSGMGVDTLEVVRTRPKK